VNFLAMLQRLHRETLRSTAAPITVATTDVRHLRMVDALKDAWRDLQAERDWKWMRGTYAGALTVGQQTYDGSADFSITRFARWRPEDPNYAAQVYFGTTNSAIDITQWNLDQFRHEFIYRQMGATMPIAWSIDEEQRLLIGPAPSAAYTIRLDYWREPFELGSLTTDPNEDEPDMPERHHMLLVWSALRQVAKSDASPEILARADEGYSDMHHRLVMDQARLPTLG
jgi:hypothetical protein